MSRRFDSIFEDEDDKAYVTFEYRIYDKTVTLNNKYDDCVTWDEILRDIVQCLEGAYGYSFDLDDLSIYKRNTDE